MDTLSIAPKDPIPPYNAFMTQSELLRQLEDHFRKQEESVAEHRHKMREEQEAISDDEWWEQAKSNMGKMRPEFMEIMERNKEEMIKNRSMKFLNDETFRDRRIKQMAIELLPFVAAVRADRSSTGDVTKDEIELASIRQSVKQMDSGLARLERSAAQIEDPESRRLAEKANEVAQEAQLELQRLISANAPSDQTIDEITSKILERSQEMLEYMRKTRRLDLDELN